MLQLIRPAAVAGHLYPASADELGRLVDALLARASAERAAASSTTEAVHTRARKPKVLVTPHAGFAYSGPTAAHAFQRLAPFGADIERAVIIGPVHRAFVDGIVWPGTTKMATPFGTVDVDRRSLARVRQVRADARAHEREHSIEVELPFLQRVAPQASVVPLAVGRANIDDVSKVLEELWGGPETVIVVSTDLSHYLPYELGRTIDERTAARILALEVPIDGDEACGSVALNGLLRVARTRGLHGELLDLKSSGDTAGMREEVVGYGAFALYEG